MKLGRIGVIDDGRLIADGTPAELKDTLGGAFLEFLEGKKLPAVAMLESRAKAGT